MSNDERKRILESVRLSSHRLKELAGQYESMRLMAENGASDAFLRCVDSVGQMTATSLGQVALMLDLMMATDPK